MPGNVFLGIDMPVAGIVTIRARTLGHLKAAIDRLRGDLVTDDVVLASKKMRRVSCQDVRNIRSGRSSRPHVSCDSVGGDLNRCGPVQQTRLRRSDVGPYTIHRNQVE